MIEYQRASNGDSIPASDYPKIPEPVQGKFFTGYGYEVPTRVHYWAWRTDYQQWGAVVTFANGWRGMTNPLRSDTP